MTPAAGRVTRIEPFGPGGGRVRLYVDGELRCELALPVVAEGGIGVGDVLEPEGIDELAVRDRLWQARDAALRLLSYRARSKQEVRRRLYHKGFEARVVEPCVARLVEEGLLDDREFAAAYARDTVRLRPRGRLGMTRELRAKGVDPAVAERAVESVMHEEEVSEPELAREVAEKWVRRQRADVVRALLAPPPDPERERVRRRLYDHLRRRGFGGDAVRAALLEAEERAREVAGGRS